MHTFHCSKVRNFFAAAVLLGASLSFATPVFAVSIPGILNPDGTLTYLGTLGGGFSVANGINNAGQVTGFSETADGSWHAFITGPNGVGMTDLGTLRGDSGGYSHGFGINNSGQVVGISYTNGGNQHAFITGPNGTGMRDLGTLGGSSSWAQGINDVGQVVGHSDITEDRDPRAFITGPNGIGMTRLGSFNGFSLATDINNAGQAVGSFPHASITGPNGVGMTELGTLGGHNSTTTAVNDAGQVVGVSETGHRSNNHAFITGTNGLGMTDLGTLGGDYSFATAINDAGQVVGHFVINFNTGEAEQHAFVTGPNGSGITDLDSLVHPTGGRIEDALGINNQGQILVSVIPESETYALLLAGLALVSFVARLRKAA